MAEVKRLTALFLTLLFLFNLVGYRLFFHYIVERSADRYEFAFDHNEYDDSQMMVIKIDLDMPYLAENTTFERVDGEINVDGIDYKYVKRKVYNGQLVLLCLPNKQKSKLKSARDEYFSIANSLISHTGSKQSPAKSMSEKNVTTDYDQYTACYDIGFIKSLLNFIQPTDESARYPAHRYLPAQPPERA